MAYDKVAERVAREAQAARDLLLHIKSDDDDLTHDMVEGETGLLEAVGVALAEIDECEIMVVGLKAKEAEMSDRRKRAERRIETLRGHIEQALVVCDMDKLKLDTATLTVKKVPPKMIITEEAEIPTQFWWQGDPVLDKAALKAALDLDQSIAGVTLSNGGVSLQIRRA